MNIYVGNLALNASEGDLHAVRLTVARNGSLVVWGVSSGKDRNRALQAVYYGVQAPAPLTDWKIGNLSPLD